MYGILFVSVAFLLCVDIYALICLLTHSSYLYVRGLRINPSALLDLSIFSHDNELVLFEDQIRNLSTCGL